MILESIYKQKTLFLFIGLFFCVQFSNAQFEQNSNSISIPKSNTPTTSVSLPKQNNMFSIPNKPNTPSLNYKPLYTGGFDPKSKKEIEMIQTETFVNPGDQIKKELNDKIKGEESVADMAVFRRNQSLGDFKTDAARVNISCRDHLYVDGDMIRVWVNDEVVMERIILLGNFQGFNLPLKQGFNKIEFEAINQGTSGPNTAEFNVYDDKGVLIAANRWDLATGFKASVVLYKN